jgi:RNA polymerase sigma-70 factor, ECF subfamily
MTAAGANLRGLSDEALAKRLIEPGAERAVYAETYRRFYPPMLREAALLLGGDMALAEDIVQGCFVRLLVFRTIEHLRTPAGLRAYLLQSVRNAAIDAFRRQKREEPLTPAIEEAAVEEPPDLWKQHPGMGPVLDRLSEPDREILELRFNQGLGLREIALRLKISYSAAAQRLSRSVQRARDVVLRL